MIKKNVIKSLPLLITFASSFQNPAHWNFTAKKLSDEKYELHLTALVDRGWHIYAQAQPTESVAVPTKIVINPSPLIKIQDTVLKEVGIMEHWEDKSTGFKANQYEDKVDFVEVVQLKEKVKTNISGNISYQTCTDEMCLPPTTIPFSVALP
jgi:cytochrome c biogenesis DsbD-like protein